MLEHQKYLSSSLSEEVSAILSEFLDVRNWTFHNPQSLMVAAREVAEKDIPDELNGLVQVTEQLNPVLINKINQYELVVLASLTIHAEKRIQQFQTVLGRMKADYQEVYDSIKNKPVLMTAHGFSDSVQFVELYRTAGLADYHSDIAQVSMAIQKSLYDGTEEKFKEWVIRPAVDGLESD